MASPHLIAELVDACRSEPGLASSDFDSLLDVFERVGSYRGQGDVGLPFMRTQRQIVTAKLRPLVPAVTELEVERLSRLLIKSYERAQIEIASELYPEGSTMVGTVAAVTHYGAHFTVEGTEVAVECISVLDPDLHVAVQSLQEGGEVNLVVIEIDEDRGRWVVRLASLGRPD